MQVPLQIRNTKPRAMEMVYEPRHLISNNVAF